MISSRQRSAGRLGPAVLALVVVLSMATGAVSGVATETPGGEQSIDGVRAASHTGLTVEPGDVTFGPVAPGEQATATVTVTNTADEPVEVGDLEFTGDTEAFLLQRLGGFERTRQLEQPVPVPAGLTRDARIVFAPESAGEYEATLTVLGPDGEPLVAVTATGTAQAGVIEASATSLSFKGTTVGSTATRPVSVSNVGDAPLSVSSRVIGSGAYSVRDGSRLALEPGESGRVTVAFAPNARARQTALLELHSNDPDRPALPITLSNTGTETTVSATQRGSDRTVDISVRDVRAGEQADVPVPTSGTDGEAVAIERIRVTPATDANLSLTVTDSSDPLPTTPDRRVGDTATGLRYLSVDHSLPNEEIQQVEYAFRMRTERVANVTAAPNDTAAANPDAIAMYRYDGTDGWVEQNTTRVRTTETHHHYVTTGDGFSEWTAAAKRPDIRVADASASVDTARAGETVDIQVSLRNDGGADGVFLTELLLNGTVVDDRRATVPDGGTVGVTFERPFDQPGNYQVRVNDVAVGIIEITSEGVQRRTATPGLQAESGADSDGDGTGDATGSNDPSSSGLPAPLSVALGAGVVVLVGILGGLRYVRSGDGTTAEATPPDTDDSVIQTDGFDTEGTVDTGDGVGTDDGDDGPDSTD